MEASRTKRTAQNAAVGFIYQLVSLILNFVSRTVFIKTLGSEFLGMNGIFSDVLSLLSMADLGFSTAMSYSFYKPLAQDDHKKIAALISFYKRVYNIIAATVLVIGLACVPFLKYIINTDQVIDHLEIYYLISLAGVVISYLFVYKTTLLSADQKDYKATAIRMWTNMLKVLVQIAVLIIFKNYMLYLAINVLFNFINNVVTSKKTEKEYPYINEKVDSSYIKDDIKTGILGNMKSVFIYKISETLFNATDNILISMLVGTVTVGLYSNYLMVSNKLLLIEQIVFSAMTASVGNVIATEKPEKRLKIFNSMCSGGFIFSGIITSGFCLLVNDLINVWIGEAYLLPLIVIVAITVNNYMSCALTPLWVYRDATGLYRKTKFVRLIGAILNLILSVILGKLIGLAGIIFASAIAKCATFVWYEPKVLFRDYFDSGVIRYYRDLLLNVLVVVITIIIIGKLSAFFVVTGWITLFIKGIIVGIIISVEFFMLYHKTEGAQLIIEKIRHIIKK